MRSAACLIRFFEISFDAKALLKFGTGSKVRNEILLSPGVQYLSYNFSLQFLLQTSNY